MITPESLEIVAPAPSQNPVSILKSQIPGYGRLLIRFWPMGHLLGYARVSTSEQDPRLQHDALTAAGCYRTFTDTASGSLASRPQLDLLLDQLRPGDTLVVWRLDRLGRSVRNLIDLITELQDRGVHFKSLQDHIDTSSPSGKLVFHIFASLAEFERDLIRERTHAGLEAARARGRVGGRPAKLSGDDVATARRLHASRTVTVAEIGRILGVSRSTVYRALSKKA